MSRLLVSMLGCRLSIVTRLTQRLQIARLEPQRILAAGDGPDVIHVRHRSDDPTLPAVCAEWMLRSVIVAQMEPRGIGIPTLMGAATLGVGTLMLLGSAHRAAPAGDAVAAWAEPSRGSGHQWITRERSTSVSAGGCGGGSGGSVTPATYSA